MLPLQIWKRYSAFHKAPALLLPHHQIISCYIQDTHWVGGLTLLRCGQCILHPQPTGPVIVRLQFIDQFYHYKKNLKNCSKNKNVNEHDSLTSTVRIILFINFCQVYTLLFIHQIFKISRRRKIFQATSDRARIKCLGRWKWRKVKNKEEGIICLKIIRNR